MSTTNADTEHHQWFIYSQRVYAFAVVLRAAERMPEDEDEYWEKPWHWDPEHTVWVEAGSPQCPQPAAPQALDWQRFVRNLPQH